jgi:phage/plasmid primase-like uncharacterized protein
VTHNPHRNHHNHSIAELKQAASGRWIEILTAAGIPAELLDRRGRPCPKCGDGTNRFAPMPDFERRGAVHCRICFNRSSNPKPGDGIASLQWWLGVDTAEAIRWLQSWLGLDHSQHHQAIHRTAIKPTLAPPRAQSEADQKRIALTADRCRLDLKDGGRDHLARSLGVTADALRRLGVGWCASRCATTWPMRDASGKIIGLRLRDPNTGAKRSVQGSAAGLFFDADGIANIPSQSQVWIAEGASDTAALLSIGLDAVGIPSAKSGGDLLLALGHRIRPSEWIIVADGDGPGLESARLLRSELVIVAGVRIIVPPSGIKDAREWINRGASRDDLITEAGAVDLFTLDWGNGGAA